MRFARCVLVLLVVAAPLAAQAKKGAKPADPDKPVSGGGHLPAGWSTRTDEKGKEADTKFVVMGKGYHVTLGPAAIFWRASDKVDGPFHSVALFTQTKRSEHPEGTASSSAARDSRVTRRSTPTSSSARTASS